MPLSAGIGGRAEDGAQRIVRSGKTHHRVLCALVLLSPLMAGCGGGSSMGDFFSSDLLSKDADWFSRPGRVFIKNVSIDTPPLTPDKPVNPQDLISADGGCPGMAPPSAATALSDGAAAAPVEVRGGTVALGHTECDVTRGIGPPDNVNLSTGPRGDRVAVVTWARGPRAGIYTFSSGRLSMIERGPEPVVAPKPSKPAKKRASG